MTIKKWNLGEAIQILRQRLKLTKSRFARLIGVNSITIARWEKGLGTEKMKLMYFFRIAKVTSIKPSELIEVCESSQSGLLPKNDNPQHPQQIISTLNAEPEAGNGEHTSEMEQKVYGKLKS